MYLVKCTIVFNTLGIPDEGNSLVLNENEGDELIRAQRLKVTNSLLHHIYHHALKKCLEPDKLVPWSGLWSLIHFSRHTLTFQ